MIDILQEPCYMLFQPFVVHKSKISFVHTRWVHWMPCIFSWSDHNVSQSCVSG